MIRILLLEDDETMRGLLAEALILNGYEVEAVGSGEQAVEEARRSPFDLIIADVRMEGMDGLSALDQVQSHRPGIGSLVITGYSTEEDSIRAIRLGVGDYLKKPFQIAAFLQAVERQANRRRQALQVQERERALKQTAAWAVESLAAPVHLADGAPALAVVARLVSAVLVQEGFAGSLAEELRLAVLLAGLRRSGQPLPPFLMEGLPPTVHHFLNLLEEDGECTPELRLGRLGLKLASRSWAGLPSSVLEGDQAGPAFDRCWASLGAGPEVSETRPGSRAGLLSVARTLEQAGELESSRTAYHELTGGEDSRASVEAWLGLARLSLAEGRPDQTVALARKAVEMAERLGPVISSEAMLQAGLLLHRIGNEAAPRLANRALELARGPGLDTLEARAVMAAALVGAALEPDRLAGAAGVLQGDVPQLAECVEWLTPFLLELQGRAPQPAVEQLLRVVLREFPGRLPALLARRELSATARLVATSCLSGWSGQGAEEALRQLCADPDDRVRAAARQGLDRGGPATPPLLRIYSLGPLEVYRGDERISRKQWKGPKVRQLLAFLAAHGGLPVAEDILIETFWPDDLDRGRRNLSASVSQLRSDLRGADEEVNYVVRVPAGFQLNPELPSWHDLDELESAAETARKRERTGQFEEALRCYRRMADLYRAPYLEGYYQDWVLRRRTRVEQLILHALVSLARASWEKDQPLEALEFAQRAIDVDPLNQEAFLYVVEANTSLKRPEEAVRRFEAYRRLLSRELGMEPSIDLLRAHQRALLNMP